MFKFEFLWGENPPPFLSFLSLFHSFSLLQEFAKNIDKRNKKLDCDNNENIFYFVLLHVSQIVISF